MSSSIRLRSQHIVLLTVSTVFLFGCGGTRLLKEPLPFDESEVLATTTDADASLTLEWVIVRGGPGSWARNADWDQYQLRVENRSTQPLRIVDVRVVDSLGTAIAPGTERKQLVKASKQTVKRYKGSDIDVKAGRGTAALLMGGAAVTVVGVSATYSAAYSALAAGSTSVGGAGTIASGMVLLGPAIVVGGVVRGVNNHKVNDQIQALYTSLPVSVPAGSATKLNVFFPIAPSPQRLVLVYEVGDGTQELVLDTTEALFGLHLAVPEKIAAKD